MSRVRNVSSKAAAVAKHGAQAAVESARLRGRRHTLYVIAAFVLFWIPVITFAALAEEIHEREPIPFDVSILTWAYEHHTPFLDNLFLFATSLGEPLSVVGAGLILVGALIYARRFRWAGALLAGVGGAALANVILKLIFARIRPDVFPALLRESGYSFPSGHAMVSAAFVITVIFILWRTRYRVPAIIVGLFATPMIGISRVYIGVHYPSDVLAGWAVAAVWAFLACSLVLDFPFKLHIHISRLLKRNA
jgi:membrane-associated phospholipid phosphatase